MKSIFGVVILDVPGDLGTGRAARRPIPFTWQCMMAAHDESASHLNRLLQIVEPGRNDVVAVIEFRRNQFRG